MKTMNSVIALTGLLISTGFATAASAGGNVGTWNQLPHAAVCGQLLYACANTAADPYQQAGCGYFLDLPGGDSDVIVPMNQAVVNGLGHLKNNQEICLDGVLTTNQISATKIVPAQ